MFKGVWGCISFYRVVGLGLIKRVFLDLCKRIVMRLINKWELGVILIKSGECFFLSFERAERKFKKDLGERENLGK